MRLFSMTVPTVAFEVSTSGETPVTVAISEIVPSSRVKLTLAVCCTCNSRSRVPVLKPSSSLFTVYSPGCNAGKSNRPTSLVVVVRVALVALFTTVTVAPGTTAPVESFTSPVMVPNVWAKLGAQRSNQVNPANKVRRMGNGSFRENVRRSTETKIDAVTNVTNKGTTKTQKQKMPRPRGMKKRKRRIAAHLLRER